MRASLLVLLLAAVGPLGVLATRAPRPLELDAPLEQFSAARALVDLEWIAAGPRPTGTAANRAVRERLLTRLAELGLETSEQSFLIDESSPRWGVTKLGENLTNLIARKAGNGDGGALLLSAHHDSVPAGPGAADDGAAVAAMLEALRALSTDAPRRHDLLILITDGEELGLVGARRFLAEHPWADEVLAVFNFEARGAGGPSNLFQVGSGSGALVDLYAANAPHPFGTSLAPAVYERMPNDTDFTLFQQRGVPGLNFAFIGGGAAYHQPTDTVDELDLGSLQQHGEAMTALVRSVGDHDFDAPPESDREFFPIGDRLVVYPRRWTLFVGIALTLTAMVFLGLRARAAKRRVSVGLASLGLVGAAVVFSGSAAWALDVVAHWASGVLFEEHLGRGSNLLSGEVVSVSLWWTALGGALFLLTIEPIRRRSSSIACGAVTVWALLAVALPIAVPGAGYLGVLGLLGVLGSYAGAGSLEGDSRAGRLLIAFAAWLPAALALAPLQALLVQVGSVSPVGEVLLGGLGAGLLLSTALPLIAAVASTSRKLASVVCLLGCVGFVARSVLFAMGS